jgi:Tol biopolymer transport system component
MVGLVAGVCILIPLAQGSIKIEPKHYKLAQFYNSGPVSADGRFLACTDLDTDDLVVRDLKTGENRHITINSWIESGDNAMIVAPGGKQVAYNWMSEDGFGELRIIGVDGSGGRILFRNEEIWWIHPHDWSPDGKLILATFFKKDRIRKQIVLVSVADNSVSVLKTLDFGTIQNMSFSRDGNYIAYDIQPQEGSFNLDIFAIALDGSGEVPLVEHPAIDLLLAWSLDGKRVLFSSDRMGTQDVWAIKVADGKPGGAPELIKSDLELIDGLGFTQDGSFYYRRLNWVNDVYITTLDSSTGKLQDPKKLFSHVGFDTSVQWSPDGRYLAYASGIGWLSNPFVLHLHSVETGKERRLKLKMTRLGNHAFQPHWSPDGRYLLAQGRDVSFRQGIYRIDAESGKVTPIVQTETPCPPDCIKWPVWSSDGKVIFTGRIPQPRSIVTRDLMNGSEKELYRAFPPAKVLHLAISPNGQLVAFLWWDREARKATLKVVPASGGEARELLKLPSSAWGDYSEPAIELAWTPNSRQIIYAVSAVGKKPILELWRVSSDGSEQQNLGLRLEGLFPFGLSIHPDGQRIAFTAGIFPDDEVWVLEHFLPAFKSPKSSRN